MIKKKITAVLIALLTAALAGCGSKITEKNSASEGGDSSAASQSNDEAAAQQDNSAPDNADSSESTDNTDGSSKNIGKSSGKSKSSVQEAVAGVIRRAEEPAIPISADVTVPPENSEEITVLIAMDSVTDYVSAAEAYLKKGGKIKVVKTSRDTLYDQIAAESVAGRHIDIAQFDNGMMFPYGITQDLIEPVDLAVDFAESRWDECRRLSEAFELNNWHYAAIFGCTAKNVLFYNKKLFAANGFADPQDLYESEQWNTEAFCGLLRSWRNTGGKYGIAGHDHEMNLCMGSGRSLITFDRACGGFSNSVYDPYICMVMNYIYGLKDENLMYPSGSGDVASAFRDGVLFWSGTREEYESFGDKSSLGTVPFPTITGSRGARCYAADYDGLVLIKGTKDLAAARAYFECAREEKHKPEDDVANVFCPEGVPIYEYGMGISPKISDSASGANGGFDKAIIPVIYTEGNIVGEWDNVVCYGFSPYINEELITENNAIAAKVYGRAK
jgi:ABC-type glycerol-3-phosphate transport system substrate-binding protein